MKKANHKRQALFDLSTEPLLIVLSGPSGAGKDAVLNRMKQQLGYPLEYITTITTRSRRPNERNDIDYHFVSSERFQEMISHKELLEWATVYGNWYGVPKQPVEQALSKGQDIIVKVDIQGAATIKKILPQAILIFLMPPSMEELVTRLKQRQTESPFDLDLRIETAEEEIEQLSLFNYVIVNRRNKIGLVVSEIKAIITAEKCRVTP